jgi:hypothetical protein
MRQLAKVFELHPKQFLPNAWQHPSYSHSSQLIIRKIQREAHALCFPEPSEELQWRLTVPLPQRRQIY